MSIDYIGADTLNNITKNYFYQRYYWCTRYIMLNHNSQYSIRWLIGKWYGLSIILYIYILYYHYRYYKWIKTALEYILWTVEWNNSFTIFMYVYINVLYLYIIFGSLQQVNLFFVWIKFWFRRLIFSVSIETYYW